MGTESDHIEMNSSVDDTHVSADGKLETPNIEISDVTENLDDNLESLLEIKEKLSSNYMRIYELPAENEIAEDNNIEISMLLSGKDDHEEEVEMMKVLSDIVDKDNFFDSESLLEENNINEWFSETKSGLPTDTEDERGVELIADACKEIDNLIDTNDEVVNSNVKAKIENEDTRVSEKFSKPDPETVKKGSIIRVLWTPKTTDSLYWIQGVVTKTFVSEVKIKKEIVKKNKVTMEKLSMIDYFGKEYCNDLPPKLQVELSSDLTWVLRIEEITSTREDNEVIQTDIPREKIRNNDDSENETEAEGVEGRISISQKKNKKICRQSNK